jgi:hypothetical protein
MAALIRSTEEQAMMKSTAIICVLLHARETDFVRIAE